MTNNSLVRTTYSKATIKSCLARTTDSERVVKRTKKIPNSPSLADESINSISAPFNPPRIFDLNYESDK
jgi:hypothetical protein